MIIQKRVCIVSLVLTVLSLLLSIIFEICGLAYGVNICMAIFGSSALSLSVALLSYFGERNKILRSYYDNTAYLLKEIKKIPYLDASNDEKMDAYITYYHISKTEWERSFDEMDFLFDFISNNKKKIDDNIHFRLKAFNQFVDYAANNFEHFKYLDSKHPGVKCPSNEVLIETLEWWVFEVECNNIENLKRGDINEPCSVYWKLYDEVGKELTQNVYSLIYGKKSLKGKNDNMNIWVKVHKDNKIWPFKEKT